MTVQACTLCLTRLESCGTLGVAESARACVKCGEPTCVRSNCKVPRHYACGFMFRMQTERVQPARKMDARPEWLGQARKTGTLQPGIRSALADTLTMTQLDTAVELWNVHMRGIAYGTAHGTAAAILNGSFGHSGIPPVPEFRNEWLAPLSSDEQWLHRSWNVIPESDEVIAWHPRHTLSGWDVNGMFLSAAACELGSGAPEHLQWPDDRVLKLPGYARVSTLSGAPWSIGEQWTEGMWMPMPLAEYLRDAGAEFLIVEALVWPKHRRWLDPHVSLMGKARSALLAAGDPVALAVLDLIKDLYTRMFGGLLHSEKYNRGPSLNHMWGDMIPATGQARMFRALDKTRGAGVIVAGVFVDAAWFIMPEGYETPPALTISTQLGKFKAAGRAPFTPELYDAWLAGKQRPLWKALSGK